MGNIYDNKKNKESTSCMTAISVALLVVTLPIIVIFVAALVEGVVARAVLCIILAALLGGEAVFFLAMRKQLERVNRYGLILEEDHDGVITFARLHDMTGIPEERIRKDFARYGKTSYKNITVDGDQIIIGKDEDFEEIICPTCGAKNTVRAGSSDKCNNCGSYLRRA